MKRVLAALVLALLAAQAVTEPIDPKDVTVIDGDTIAVRMQPNVRLVGFNAPETWNAACEAEHQLGEEAEHQLGEKAARRLHDLVAAGHLDTKQSSLGERIKSIVTLPPVRNPETV